LNCDRHLAKISQFWLTEIIMGTELRSGKLTKWKDDRGFGFIQPDEGGQDVFVHISNIKAATRRPEENDRVQYQSEVDDSGKLRALNVSIVGASVKERPTSTAYSADVRKPNKSATAKFLAKLPLDRLALLCLLPVGGSLYMTVAKGNFVPLVTYAVMGCAAFALYKDDKARAKRGDQRIPEKTLHWCEFLGGWIGAFMAQQAIHHKNKKQSYQLTFWTIVAAHQIYWAYWIFQNI
jgi:uncharacterized membrane protein YsdA (DUF1294 family)/cold shock CspA family protein